MVNKVLIVGDSMVSRMMIKEIIKSEYNDCECIQAASADKAIEACKNAEFDFVTLDLNMPGLSGLEAAPHIQQAQSHAKVALLAANDDVELSAVNHHGLTFLSKPINSDEILNFIKSH